MRISLSFMVVLFIAGFVTGYVVMDLRSTPINYDGIYSTIPGGYLSDNPDALELLLLCEEFKDQKAVTIRKVIDILQEGEIILKAPKGGRFKVIATKSSRLLPGHVFVQLQGEHSDTAFWVDGTSIKKAEKEDVK